MQTEVLMSLVIDLSGLLGSVLGLVGSLL